MIGRLTAVFGIPPIDPRALGFFRAWLGASLFLIVWAYPLAAIPLEAQQVYSPLASAAWVRSLAASEAAMIALRATTLLAAGLFALGLFARPAYVVLVVALFVRTLVILLRAGAHDWGTPLITLIALVVVPWGDAPSLLRLLRPRAAGSAGDRAPAGVTSARYGFAVWLPGLTLGVAFFAAALEKLRRSGVEWVTNGSVRYHFVEDAQNAPFELGLWIASRPDLAVALSFLGLLVEALFIGVIFVRDWRARAAFGAAAAGLMLGFWVFQGIHWWAWLMLLAAFLPWGRRGTRAIGALRPAHALVVALIVAGQVWASYRRIEVEPLLSHYPMYSTTYSSPEDYEHHHERLVVRAGGVDITERIHALDAGGVVSRAIEVERGERPADAETEHALAEFVRRYSGQYGTAPAHLEILMFKRPFDWQAGQFKPEVFEPLGRIDLGGGS